MIRDAKIAKEISDLMIELSHRLNDSITMVREKCPEGDFDAYRKGAAKVMGYIYLDIMTPLYQAHPELKPEGLR